MTIEDLYWAVNDKHGTRYDNLFETEEINRKYDNICQDYITNGEGVDLLISLLISEQVNAFKVGFAVARQLLTEDTMNI